MPDIDSMKLKMMEKVEGLLAKAESTEFPEERDSFITKAQELMTKYAIEEASLRKGQDASEIVMEHIQVNMDKIKYTKAVATLITAVGQAQNAYVVFTPKSGKQRGFAFATVFGSPTALDLVLMMVSSLHKQLEIALRDTPVPEWEHGKTFRNNFVISFANAINMRLREAKEETIRNESNKSAALVLVNEAERAEEAGRNHFGRVSTASSSTGRHSSAGQAAGWKAGMDASLARGEVN